MGESGATPGKPKILYIAGWGRSGSTILGNVLAQVPGFFHGGEIWFLGQEGWRERGYCGCGKEFDQCELWSPVLDKLEGIFGKRALDNLQRDPVKTRDLVTLILSGHLTMPRAREEKIVGVFRQLYGLAAATSGATVVVDSSKSPIYARLVQDMGDFDLHIVHLVRDPRAAAFSWRRRKYDPTRGRHLVRRGLVISSLLWMIWNVSIEGIWNRRTYRARYLRVRYEDLAERPQPVVRRILEFVGEPASLDVVSGKGVVRLRPTHTLAGNPLRLEHGQVEIRKDEEWRTSMKWHHKALIAALTWPFLVRYEYPVWG